MIKRFQMKDRVRISIIIATFNSSKYLNRCLNSLYKQIDKNFKIYIADNCSTDNTVKIIDFWKKKLKIKVRSKKDYGIYDAINQTLRSVDTEYYLVLGSDDFLYPRAIKEYYSHLNHDYDLVTFPVKTDSGVRRPHGSFFINLSASFCSVHSVGVLIKTSLHKYFGFYNLDFTIAADTLFLSKVYIQNRNISRGTKLVGFYSEAGKSNIYLFDSFFQLFKINLVFSKTFILPLLLFITRLVKNYFKLSKRIKFYKQH